MKIPEHLLIIEQNSNGWWCGYAPNPEIPTRYLHRNGRWLTNTFNPDDAGLTCTGYFDTREALEIILYNNPNFGPWHEKFEELTND